MSKAVDRATWMRASARTLGTVAAAFWAFGLLMGAVTGGAPLDAESAVMAGLVVASVLGVVLAWRREALGGAIVLVCGIAHTIFACLVASRNQLLAIGVAGLPFFVAGLLFLGVWWRTRSST